MLTLNNFIDFSERISKLERENERLQKLQQISQARSEQIIGSDRILKLERENERLQKLQHISQARSKQKIGKVEREKDGLNDLNLKLEREHNVFQAQYIY